MSDGILGRRTLGKGFAQASITAFVIYFAGAGLTFLSQVVMARILGPESFGIYVYVFACMSVLTYGAALGFQISLLRFVSAYEATQSWSLLRGYLQYAERRVAVICLLVYLLGNAWIAIRGDAIADELRSTFQIGFLLVPAWAFLWLRASAVRAFGGVVFALLPERVMRDSLLLAFILIASLGFNWTLLASTVMAATVASTSLGLVLAGLAMNRLRPKAIRRAVPEYDSGVWKQAAFPLLVYSGTDAFFNRTGALVLGWLGETTNAGIYGLVFSIALVAVLPRTAVDTLFAPAISRLYAQRQFAELQALVTRAASWSLFAAAGAAIVLALVAETLLAWFGPEYVAGADALRILLLGQVISASAGSQTQVLAMTGHERNLAISLVANATFNCVVSFLLISEFGVTGAAWGMTISLALWNASMALVIWRRLALWPGIYGALRPN